MSKLLCKIIGHNWGVVIHETPDEQHSQCVRCGEKGATVRVRHYTAQQYNELRYPNS